jgi:phosphoenolpyruvate phosphomutase
MEHIRFFWGVYDAISTAVVDEFSQDGLWLSGLCHSASHGLPDTELIGVQDLSSCVRTIRRISRLPLWVDCNSGFGSSHNLAIASEELQIAGADGICIEDKLYPKRNTFLNVVQVLEDVAAFCQKISYSKQVLSGSNCLLIARTESLAIGLPLGAALERASRYAEAGADALVISTRDETPHRVLDFLVKWQARLPIVLIPTSYEITNVSELQSLGVSVIIYANQLLRSNIATMRRVLKQFQSDIGSIPHYEDMVGIEELIALFDKRST